MIQRFSLAKLVEHHLRESTLFVAHPEAKGYVFADDSTLSVMLVDAQELKDLLDLDIQEYLSEVKRPEAGSFASPLFTCQQIDGDRKAFAFILFNVEDGVMQMVLFHAVVRTDDDKSAQAVKALRADLINPPDEYMTDTVGAS